MLNKIAKRPIMYYLASFILPLIIILYALICLHIVPFGDHTLIISDAKGLYISYLSYAGRMFQGMERVTYSFEKGLGGNMMPHMGGSMLNPLFSLIALFHIADYPLAFTLISTLNICVCGLTMYILLADLLGHKRSNLIFSTSYALSGFLVANVFQIIFFTGCHALPLMVMGLRKIFQGKTPLLYILSIMYATITAVYFGFTLCVASLLFFIVLLWLKKDELKGRKISIFINYGTSSLCAGLVPILIWLPGYMGIMGGRASQTKITDFSFLEKMPFIEIFSKLFTGANTTSQLMDGLPNIFVGLLPVVLVILFFMNKKISKRIKISAGIVIGFYLLGFYIIAFDMMLHGGTTTNWFNFRYSYIFSFVLLVIAAYEWQYIDELSNKDLKRCFIGLGIATILIFSKKYEYVMGGEVLLDFGLLLVIYLAYHLYKTNPEFNPKHTFEAVTLFIVCISLFLNYTICTKNIQDWELSKEEYTNTVNAVNPLIAAVQDADKSFYRMEVNHQLTESCGNDPMLYGYNGVGHGGSNERNFVREELFKLGVQWFDMRNYYAQGIPAATDALLGIRYLISDEEPVNEKNYLRLTDMEDQGLDFDNTTIYDLYTSDYALPIAFVAKDTINGIELTDDDLFDNLNRVWKSISGEDKSVFVEENDISFKTLNLSASSTLEAEEARSIIQEIYEKSNSDSEFFENGVNSSTQKNNGTGNYNSTKNETVSTETTNAAVSESTSEDTTNYHLMMDEPPMFVSSIEFSFTAAQDGPVYIYHRGALMPENGNAESLVKYMGDYHKGDIVKGYLAVPADYVNKITLEEYAGRFRAAYAELDNLKNLSHIVCSRPSSIEKIKDSHLKGTMTLDESQELLFTIPWDTGWTCYVDGKKVQLTKVLDVFMAAQVSPGEHTYEMFYQPGGMNLAEKISGSALIILILYLAIGRKQLNKALIKKMSNHDLNLMQEKGENKSPFTEEAKQIEDKTNDSV